MVEVEEDGDLAQAKHRIRVLEREFREQAERMAKLERKVLVAVELAAHHHEEADRMRRLRDQAALEHATLRATAEDYAVRQEAIRRALDAAGVVAVEAAGAVPPWERVRRLAVERDEARSERQREYEARVTARGSVEAWEDHHAAEVRRAVEEEREALTVAVDEAIATTFENSRRAESKGSAPYTLLFLEAAIRSNAGDAIRARGKE